MESRVQLNKVHFFEMVAQEKFSKYLRSALYYITNVLLERHPSLISLRYYRDSILTALEGLIQAYYLKTVGSTYSEYYYGIERIFKDNKHNPTKSKIQLFKTLFLLVICPLIKRKLDNYFRKTKEDLEEGIINTNNTNKRKLILYKLLVKVYPVLDFVSHLVKFTYNAKYLLKANFNYYTPDYHILKHGVGRRMEEEPETPGRFGFLIDILKRYFIFFIYLGTKFLEWHFDSNRKRDDILEKDKTEIQAPFKAELGESKKNLCQICHQSINIPCCLDTCGFVFCQTCIYDYVQKIKKCPITQVDCTVNNIHKIYES